MRRFVNAVPLLVLTACTLPAFLSTTIAPVPAFAAQEETVTETIPIVNVKPTAVLRQLTQRPEGSKSLVPEGIISSVPDDAKKSLTVTGTKKAITELRELIRLLDVKPRQVTLKTRLLEISLGPSGVRQKTLLQSSLLNANNNQDVLTAISGTESEKEEIFVTFTPHINPDHTVSLLAKMERRWETGAKPQTYETSAVEHYRKIDEWITMRTMSFSQDPKIQKVMKSEETPPAAAYPLYRVEVFCTDLREP